MIQGLNESLFFFVHGFANQTPVVDSVIVFMADEFAILVGLIAGVFLITHIHKNNVFIFFHRREDTFMEGVTVAFVVVSTWVITLLLKLVVFVPRPFLLYPFLEPLVTHGGFDSFPSGHTAFLSSLGFVLFHYHRRAGLLCLLSALLVGMARVGVGIHTPFDIVGGFVVAFVVSYVVVTILPRFSFGAK